LLIAFILFIWYKIKRYKFNYDILKSKKWLLFSFVIIIICFSAVTKNSDPSFLNKYYLLLAECICVGFLEELLCRYILFEYLLTKTKKYNVSIALASLIFAIFHISNLFSGSSIYSTINQIELAFIIGLLLQFVFIKTNNLIIIITIHAVINFLGSHSSLTSHIEAQKISFNDFILNQLFILVIYLMVVPIYFWRLRYDRLD
jgi:membrane protease YdiL (CAAX protease family)